MKKKYQFQKNIIFFAKSFKDKKKKMIYLSFRENLEIHSKLRYIFFLDTYMLSNYSGKSKSKLRCLISLSKSVPNARYHLSRFYLVKFSDNLLVQGLTKK